MLSSLHVQNYKCFEDLKLTFKRMTLLTGGNACGKSSVIQLLRYISTIKRIGKRWGVATDIDGIDYGPAFLILADKGVEDSINITIEKDDSYSLKFFPDKRNQYLFSVRGERIKSLIYNFKLYYINAERTAPKTMHNISDNTDWYVGARGEYTVSLLSYLMLLSREKNKLYRIKKLLPIFFDDKREEAQGFEKLCNKWLSYIVGETQFFSKAMENVPYHQLMIKNEAEAYVPAATGFGISYCLPIVVQGLALAIKNDGILIVENPEAHLHPRSQSRMGGFLALLACSGVQTIVETHSEHIVNGARRVFCDQDMSGLMNTIFFERSNGKFNCEEISLNANGELSNWPIGFFDQADIDNLELLRRKLLNA